MTPEMRRILSLPIVAPISDEEVTALSRELLAPAAYEGRCRCGNLSCTTIDGQRKPMRLLVDQAAGFRAFREHGCLFGSISVGGGKTALAYLAAGEWFRRKRGGRVLYLLPPDLVKPLLRVHLPWARQHFPGTWIPRWINLHGKSAANRIAYARRAMSGVYVVPFSLLSQDDAPRLLELIDADFVIADEAHLISGESNSGRNRTFWRYVKGKEPFGVAMSGTFNNTTPKDFYRILRWILRQNSPIPRTMVEADIWANMLQAKTEKPTTDELLEIRPLVRWAAREFPNEMTDLSESSRTVRRAFQFRLVTTPGVVASSGREAINTRLHILNVQQKRPGKTLQTLIDEVEDNWITPEGELLSYALEKHETLRQLTAGFYLHHYWDESKPRVKEAKQCWEARKEYVAALRDFLKTGLSRTMKLDLPRSVGRYHYENGAIKGWEFMFHLWKEWKKLEVPGLPDRDTRFVAVDTYKLETIASWAEWALGKKRPGGVIWVNHVEFGDWVFDYLRRAGLNPARKRQGDTWTPEDGSQDRVVVASAPVFGKGHNLQHYSRQCLAQWCRSSGVKAEQLLGRLHRTNQGAEVVRTAVLNATEFDHQQVAATLLDTIYDQQTFGGRRKLLIAEWEPEPRQYPADFLKERGFGLLQFGSSDENENVQGNEA